MCRGILFFADKLPPLVGGMEVHADYFIKHFAHHKRFRLLSILTKNENGQDQLSHGPSFFPIHLRKLPHLINPSFLFFNSGRWIEELSFLRKIYPKATFIYRTGGNEILKAPLTKKRISNHKKRQAYWVKTLNTNVDLLITNSNFTENRLRALGITSLFLRCVGGVHTEDLALCSPSHKNNRLTLFCAARFVAYKNHLILINLVENLIKRGHRLELKLAGDGPLRTALQKRVTSNKLEESIKFLGTIDNKKVRQEIAYSDIYIQLSGDHMTKVEGGSYIHSEGMGRSLLEAISLGTYVIAGHSGALSEIVTSDRGLLVNPQDMEAMIESVEQVLVQQPTRRRTYQGYSWSAVFKKYETFMETNSIETPSRY